jgi:hypothetical protein
MTDFDNDIRFWLRGIPYVWVNGRTIDQCKRFYIVPPRTKIVTFNERNEAESLTEVKTRLFGQALNLTDTFSLLPIPEGCQLPRHCFLIWLGKHIQARSVRLEGKNVDFTEFVDFPQEFVIDDPERTTFKRYNNPVRELEFYRGAIGRYPDYLKAFMDVTSKEIFLPPFETYDQIQQRLPYHFDEYNLKYTIHRGQCKLFLNEIQFLTRFLNKNTDKDIVIYPGGCPANHMWYLLQFFPNLKIISIDPTPCQLYVGKRGNTHYSQKVWNDYIYLAAGQTATLKKDLPNIIGDGNPANFVNIINSTNASVYFIQDLMTLELAEHLKTLEVIYL